MRAPEPPRSPTTLIRSASRSSCRFNTTCCSSSSSATASPTSSHGRARLPGAEARPQLQRTIEGQTEQITAECPEDKLKAQPSVQAVLLTMPHTLELVWWALNGDRCCAVLDATKSMLSNTARPREAAGDDQLHIENPHADAGHLEDAQRKPFATSTARFPVSSFRMSPSSTSGLSLQRPEAQDA